MTFSGLPEPFGVKALNSLNHFSKLGLEAVLQLRQPIIETVSKITEELNFQNCIDVVDIRCILV